MSGENEDVSLIVQSFVESELASLDSAANHTDSLQLNNKYTEPVKSSALTGPPRTATRHTTPPLSKASSSSTSTSNSRVAPKHSPAGKKPPSTTSSSESHDQRRSSLGDKFKLFGRRITSNNSK